MKFNKTNLKDAVLIEPFTSSDVRGEFIKNFHTTEYQKNCIPFEIKEEMVTVSKTGVIRGMHFQLGKPQGKIVSCLKGAVYDYIVDLRKDSPTYLCGQGFILNEYNKYSLYVPRGFAHGYLVLSDSIISYKCDEEFYKDGDSAIRFDDPDLNICWPEEMLPQGTEIILSDKDLSAKSFKSYEAEL